MLPYTFIGHCAFCPSGILGGSLIKSWCTGSNLELVKTDLMNSVITVELEEGEREGERQWWRERERGSRVG
jgi:hypothetical protein